MDSLDTKSIFGAKKENELGVGIGDEKSSFDMGEIGLSTTKTTATEDRFSRSSDEYSPRSAYGLDTNTSSSAQPTVSYSQQPQGMAQQNTYNSGIYTAPKQEGVFKADDTDYATEMARYANKPMMGTGAPMGMPNPSNNTYIPPQENNNGEYVAAFPQAGVYYSGAGTGTMSDYAEENNVLTKINKIKKNVEQASGWLTVVGSIEFFCGLIIAIVALVVPDLSSSAGLGMGMVVFQSITAIIFTALAFGVEKKSFGASLAATIIQGLVLLVVLVGASRAALFYRAAVLVALIAATKSISDYNKMKPQYQFHPNPRIAELFYDNPVKQGRKVYKTIIIIASVVLMIIGFVAGIAGIFGGGLGDFLGEKPVSEWSYVDTGRYDFKMPMEDVYEQVDGGDRFYSAITLNAGIEVEAYEGAFDGWADYEIKAYLPVLFEEMGYDDYFINYEESYGYDPIPGSDSSGKMGDDMYFQRAYLDDDDGENVVLRAIAVEDDLVIVTYFCYPEDGMDYNDMADEYFATATRNY